MGSIRYGAIFEVYKLYPKKIDCEVNYEILDLRNSKHRNGLIVASMEVAKYRVKYLSTLIYRDNGDVSGKNRQNNQHIYHYRDIRSCRLQRLC